VLACLLWQILSTALVLQKHFGLPIVRQDDMTSASYSSGGESLLGNTQTPSLYLGMPIVQQTLKMISQECYGIVYSDFHVWCDPLSDAGLQQDPTNC
jgi:hypothetical protein